MANYDIDISDIESRACSLLTKDDEERILATKEFDYYMDPLQENQLGTQNAFEDEKDVVDIILEEEEKLREEEAEREFNTFYEYLSIENDDSDFVNVNVLTSNNDCTIEEVDCSSIPTNKETTLGNIGQKFMAENSARTKTKGELKEMHNEEDRRWEKQPIIIPHHRNTSPRKTSKHKMAQSAKFYDDKIKLDEFLKKLLDDEKFSSFIHWTNKGKKEFKLVNAGQISNLWGEVKGKRKFTSDKLLREMRHLRNNGLMHKLERKDHYKFS